jgi:hypothetical protein
MKDSSEEMFRAIRIFRELGLQLVSHSGFTHLTMPSTTRASNSAIYSIASRKPIVTIRFWESLLTSIKDNTPFPNPRDFTPQIKGLNDPNADRTKLTIRKRRKCKMFT